MAGQVPDCSVASSSYYPVMGLTKGEEYSRNGLTLKSGELLEHPTAWWRGQSAGKACKARNLQRLSVRGVGSSDPKRLTPKGEDIVWSAWKHAAARKCGVARNHMNINDGA